jgi:hypothetical protein
MRIGGTTREDDVAVHVRAKGLRGHAGRYVVGLATDDREAVVPGSGGNDHARSGPFGPLRSRPDFAVPHRRRQSRGQSSHRILPQETVCRLPVKRRSRRACGGAAEISDCTAGLASRGADDGNRTRVFSLGRGFWAASATRRAGRRIAQPARIRPDRPGGSGRGWYGYREFRGTGGVRRTGVLKRGPPRSRHGCHPASVGSALHRKRFD